MGIREVLKNPGGNTPPYLINSLSGHDAETDVSDSELLQQSSPPSTGAQPWLVTDYVQEEEQETYGFGTAPSDGPEVEDIDRKMASLQREEAALRAANGQSRADLTRVYAMAQRQQQKMEELEQCLLDTRQQLREKDEEIRKDNENMARLKAQLEAIAESLDENNASRQMLLNLISQTF